MKRINVTDKSTWQEISAHSAEEEVLIERDGHTVALIVPFDDDDREWYVRERDPAFINAIARAREQVKKGNVVSHDELRAELGLQPSKKREQILREFHEQMLDIYRQAKRQLGYNATRFLQMVTERGGYSAARDLLATNEVSEGFTELSLRGNRLDLSVEFLVLTSPWCTLFSDAELDVARKRLVERRFEPPASSDISG